MSLLIKEKKDAINIINSSKEAIENIGSKQDIESLDKSKKSLLKDNTYVVVCGECSVGKSSFLTEYIKEDGLFPIDADVSTNCITLIKYGEKENITVVLRNEKGKYKEKSISRDEISDYVTEQGNKRNKKNVSTIKIETPNETLKNGLVLVDTPGVGGLDKDHSEVTASFIPSADAVIYASTALKPLDTYELEFIKDKIASYCDNVVFTLTKADKASAEDKDAIVSTNGKKISDYTGWSGDDIRIVPISSLAMQAYRKRGKKRHLINSNFEELNNQIVQSYTNRKITKTILPNIQNVKGILLENYKVQAEKYNTLLKDGEEIKQLKNKLKEANINRRELLKQNQTWRSILSRGTKNMVSDLNKQARIYIDEIAAKVEKDTNVDLIIENEEQANAYIKDVQKRLGDAGAKLQQSCDLYKSEIIQEIGSELSQNLAVIDTKADFAFADQSFNKNKMIGKKEMLVNVIRAGSIGAGAGMFAGTAVISIFGAALVWPATLAMLTIGGLSMLLGGKRSVYDAKQKNNNIVYSSASKCIQESRRIFSEFINSSRIDIEDHCTIEVENRIKSQIEKYETMLDELPDQITKNQEKRRVALSDTKAKVDGLSNLIARTNTVIKSYIELSDKLERQNEQKLNEYKEKLKQYDKMNKEVASKDESSNTAEQRLRIGDNETFTSHQHTQEESDSNTDEFDVDALF